MEKVGIQLATHAETIDITEMSELDAGAYNDYLDGGLFFMDHRGNIRAVHGEYPIATTKAQAQLLSGYLQKRVKHMN